MSNDKKPFEDKKCPECNRSMIVFIDHWKCNYCNTRWTPNSLSKEMSDQGSVDVEDAKLQYEKELRLIGWDEDCIFSALHGF